MDNQKIKNAFSNVKRDILFLKKELENIENRFNSSLKNQLETINISLQKLEKLSEDNAHKISYLKNRDVVIKQHYLPEDILNEFSNLKEKVNSFEQQLSSSKSNEEIIELLQGKLDMEIQNLRYEINENFLSINDTQSQDSTNDEKIQSSFNEFSEMVHEKISMETNTIRHEITQEIGKLYDTFFSEIVDLKKEIEQMKKNDEKKDYSPKKPKKQSQNKKKRSNSSKMKKVANWFLEDDEEDKRYN